jgi:hypothetical protein
MEVFDRITEQIDAVRLPLFAVTLTALPHANTPVLLMLHWHGFGPDPDGAGGSQGPAACSPIPGSALQLNLAWNTIARLDHAMLDAAWQLGAWELDREERRGCNTPGAAEREAMECRQAFGGNPLDDHADPLLLVEAPDLEPMLQLGARLGYVHWKFRPVRGGVWVDTAEDDTLSEDGGRRPPCPVAAKSTVGTRVSATRYRLGQGHRIILPG